MTKRFALPEDFANEVRLFPLPDLVMFPGNVQPLHIFEERYREMLEDALAHDGLLAIATLQPGFDENEYFSRPSVADQICIGKIAGCEETEKGTHSLLLVGLRRAMIEQELPPHRSFREAKVQLLADDFRSEPLPHEKTLIHTLVARVQHLSPASSPMLNALIEREPSLAELTDVLAFHSNLGTDTKLRLLGEPTAYRRAEMMLAAMPSRPSFDGGELPSFSMN